MCWSKPRTIASLMSPPVLTIVRAYLAGGSAAGVRADWQLPCLVDHGAQPADLGRGARPGGEHRIGSGGNPELANIREFFDLWLAYDLTWINLTRPTASSRSPLRRQRQMILTRRPSS